MNDTPLAAGSFTVDRSDLDEYFESTPMIVLTRRKLDSIRRLMKGFLFHRKKITSVSATIARLQFAEKTCYRQCRRVDGHSAALYTMDPVGSPLGVPVSRDRELPHGRSGPASQPLLTATIQDFKRAQQLGASPGRDRLTVFLTRELDWTWTSHAGRLQRRDVGDLRRAEVGSLGRWPISERRTSDSTLWRKVVRHYVVHRLIRFGGVHCSLGGRKEEFLQSRRLGLSERICSMEWLLPVCF